MIRPWHTWLAFGLCLAVGLTAMGWISLTVVRLDRAETEARRQAALEGDIRLALWRMESALAPIIAQESARPYFSYTSFYSPTRAYTSMFAEIQAHELLLPSPLLTHTSPYVLLHFQLKPDGKLTSPQVPTGNMRDLAETSYTTAEKIEPASRRLAELDKLLDRQALLAAASQAEARPSAPALSLAQRRAEPGQRSDLAQARVGQIQRRALEHDARQRAQQQAEVYTNAVAQGEPAPSKVAEGVMRSIWVNGALLLARRVSVDQKDYVQGCWLDWAAIKGWLLEEVADLLPAAGLEPAKSNPTDVGALRLAALPLRLVPGAVPSEPRAVITPVRLALAVTWACVGLAAVAVAALLRGAVSLSERRGAFVSAVTHELRTPLTTFRLYTDLLAEGKIKDESKRGRYLSRLRSEADRLAHLVENVLAYARLERGRAARQVETLSVGELLERVKDRLAERAGRAEMQLVVGWDELNKGVRVRADVSVVEQILLNLVDNACKYAAIATDRRILVSAGQQGQEVAVRVRDHGPGIGAGEAHRLFRPFSKSAREAANSAPGVGLGLALSRRLARTLGGDLHLDKSVADGACFLLSLPVAT